MEKTALSRDEGDLRRVARHGRIWDTMPVSAHIVALDSLELRTLADHIRVAEDGRPRWECLESVYVLAKGYLLDSAGQQRVIFRSMSRESLVLAMAIEFINLFQRGWQPRFNPGPYLGDVPIGEVMGTFGGWNGDGSPVQY